MMRKLSEMQKSALLEAGNIGSGHSAIALSQLMGRKIMIAIPSIEIVQLKDVSRLLNYEHDVVQIGMAVLGDIMGVMFFTQSEESAKQLCDVVMGQEKGTTVALGEIEISAMKEIGSILGASYLNALSEMTKMLMLISVPELAVGKMDMMEGFLRRKEVKIAKESDIFCIRTEFIEAAAQIEGYLIFTPDDDSIDKLMEALGV